MKFQEDYSVGDIDWKVKICLYGKINSYQKLFQHIIRIWNTLHARRSDTTTLSQLQTFKTDNKCRSPLIFQKSCSHLQILCSRQMTWRNFCTQDPQSWKDLWTLMLSEATWFSPCELTPFFMLKKKCAENITHHPTKFNCPGHQAPSILYTPEHTLCVFQKCYNYIFSTIMSSVNWCETYDQ